MWFAWNLTGRFPGRLPGRFPERFPGRFPGRFSGRLPGRFPGRFPERSPERFPGRFPERYPERFLERVPESFLGSPGGYLEGHLGVIWRSSGIPKVSQKSPKGWTSIWADLSFGGSFRMHFSRLGYERGSESRAREPQSEQTLYICSGFQCRPLGHPSPRRAHILSCHWKCSDRLINSLK